MTGALDFGDDAAACDFVEAFTADRERGRSIPLRDYLARFPGHEARIAREFLLLTEGDGAAEPESVPRGGDTLGPYHLRSVLGHGGQGVVHLAEDTRLGRRVALKVLALPGGALPAAHTARLRREAQALARLDHPGICAIYEAELDGERPYLAMRYVEGETLALRIARARDGGDASLPPRTTAEVHAWLEFFERAAAALHAAHEVGIVHRDVKPGNLMRASDGQPVLLDFGLARDLESTTASLTQPGELFGTLPYMAPELLTGRAVPDRRADVYALGVTLYECLTLRRPFEAPTHEALRRAIETETATSARQVNPHVPRDLAVVLATALERDPARRYRTARAFADDLRRVRAGEPILARPAGLLLRAKRWVARHPVFGVAFLLLVAGLATALVLLAQVVRGRTELLALREAYQAQAMSAERPGLALHIAIEAAHKEPHPEINDILLRILDKCWEERAIGFDELRGAAGTAPSAWPAIDARGRWLMVGQASGRVLAWDLSTGVLAHTLEHGGGGATVAVFCGGGAQVLSGGRDGRVVLWDLARRARVRTWDAHAAGEEARDGVTFVALAPGEERAVTCGADGVACVIDLAGDGAPVRCVGHGGALTFAAFDARGARVLTLGDHRANLTPSDRTVRVFDARTGAQALALGPFTGPVRWAAWSWDGTRIVVANDDGDARVFDAMDGAEVARLPHGGQVNWAEFAPGDRCVVTGSPDGVVVWDLATRAIIRRHASFGDRSAYRGRFSPDATKLAIIAWDNTARLYDVATWDEVRVLAGHSARPIGLCWDPGGTRLATVEFGLRVWYAGDRPYLPALRGHTDRVVAASFNRDGALALTASRDATARTWNARNGHPVRVLAHGAAVRSARFAQQSDDVVTASEGEPPRLWRGEGDAVVLGTVPATDAWFARGDRVVVALGGDGVVRLFDAATGAPQHELCGHVGAIASVAFDAARERLATGGSDRTVRVWDLARASALFASPPWPAGTTGRDDERAFGVAFDPRGERLVASCEDMKLRTFALRDGTCRAVPYGQTLGRLAFARGGEELLAAGQWSGFVVRYDGERGEPIQVVARHANLITSLAMDRDGALALSASKDGTVVIFDPRAERPLTVIHASSTPVLDAQFSPDGAQVITAAADGAVRIWPVDPLAVAERYRPER